MKLCTQHLRLSIYWGGYATWGIKPFFLWLYNFSADTCFRHFEIEKFVQSGNCSSDKVTTIVHLLLLNLLTSCLLSLALILYASGSTDRKPAPADKAIEAVGL